ncbi:beta-phosphoglucomutase [Pyrococcus sp. ST04]|uniref:Uncharacterized protein n=2 Tax=Pyrococcus sp. ST04 TaxID=1183377 RepID=A0ACD6B8M1_9EURY|nr:beta-phosphoglucomutase [Pyrococcus sp. ST04]AFK23075.1 hypothetical protein containing HAD-like domain [Pyrococcus sp. ST04]
MIGIIWDFDGVLVFTPHEKAWKIATEMYGATLTHDFFVKYVSGRPRYEGAANILSRLGIYQKLGVKTEEEKLKLLLEFAELKNRIVNEMFERGEYEVNWEAIKFLLETKEKGIKNALASASKNAEKLARKIKVNNKSLLEIFDLNVSGRAETKEDVFKLAKEELKLNFPEIKYFFVVEDAPSGIRAGKAIGAITLGYERESSLEEADFRFSSFGELSVDTLLSLIGGGGDGDHR